MQTNQLVPENPKTSASHSPNLNLQQPTYNQFNNQKYWQIFVRILNYHQDEVKSCQAILYCKLFVKQKTAI